MFKGSKDISCSLAQKQLFQNLFLLDPALQYAQVASMLNSVVFLVWTFVYTVPRSVLAELGNQLEVRRFTVTGRIV